MRKKRLLSFLPRLRGRSARRAGRGLVTRLRWEGTVAGRTEVLLQSNGTTQLDDSRLVLQGRRRCASGINWHTTNTRETNARVIHCGSMYPITPGPPAGW